MRSKLSILLLYVCMLTCNTVAHSREYRITQNGVPLDKQLAVIISEINNKPGLENITIKIDGGYYSIRNTIKIKDSCHRITIQGSKKAPTIISGSIAVSDWVVMPDGLWRTRVRSVVGENYIPDQLFVNGIRATRARTPNDGVLTLKEGIEDKLIYAAVLYDEDGDKVTKITEEDVPIITIYRKWNVSKRYLIKVSERGDILYFSGKEFPSYNKLTGGNGLVIENAKVYIDQPGEWCVDRKGFIYYLPREGETIDETEFRVPVVEKLLTIQTTNDISFKNVVFEHTTFQIPEEGIEYSQSASGMSAAIELDNVKNCSFEDCEIRNIANYGIWYRLNCSESLVSRTYFHNLGAGAVKIGTNKQVSLGDLTNHITIDNNIICQYGELMESAVGIILFHASDCKIINNVIHDGNYSGISVGWVWGFDDSPSKRNEVAYNKVSKIGKGLLNDIGGIYTLGKSEGTRIHHNVIFDVKSGDHTGWGIYADEGTSGILFDRNVVYQCTAGGFHQHYGSENTVMNNIFAWGEKSQFTFSFAKVENPLSFMHNIIIMQNGVLLSGEALFNDHFAVGNNCYWSISSELPQVGRYDVMKWIQDRDMTSVYQDPQFRDPQNADFRFKKKTICKIIGFEPFDYSKAGVYGKRKWKKLAANLL